MRRFLSILVIALLVAPTAWAIDPAEMFDDPVMEERARDLGRSLRCVKCRNQSIFDSNAGIAKDLRMVVRERIEAGDTDDEVLNYVHDRYGDYVLLKPPVTNETTLLWLTPGGLVILAGLSFVFVMRSRRRPAPVDDLNDADRQAARRILEGDPK
jgi:cytochrome c-type biogenesis protein CcmH